MSCQVVLQYGYLACYGHKGGVCNAIEAVWVRLSVDFVQDILNVVLTLAANGAGCG